MTFLKSKLALLLILAFFLSILPSEPNFAAAAVTAGKSAAVRFLVTYPDYFDSYQRNDIVNAFKKSYPKIKLTVDYKMLPDLEKSLTDALKNYDVVMVYSADGLIERNSSRLAELGKLEAAQNNIFAKGSAINGKIYGIPCTAWLEPVWYRKSIFKEYGISVPKTWNEFVNAAKKIRDGGRYKPIAMGIHDGWSLKLLTQSLPCIEYGKGSLWNDMLSDKAPFSANKPFYNALGKLKQLADGKLLYQNPASNNSQGSLDLFKAKKAAMILWREYIKDELRSNKDIGAFFLPARSKVTDRLNITANIDSYLLVSKTSKNMNEAIQFVNWHFSKKWYPAFINVRAYTSMQKNIKTDYWPVIKEAFTAAGSNTALISPNQTSMAYLDTFFSSGINLISAGIDVINGKKVEDITKTFNNQWERALSMPSGNGAPPMTDGVSPLQGDAVDLNPDNDIILNNSVLINTGCRYAYVNGIKTWMDSTDHEVKPLKTNGEVAVPAGFISDAFGADVDCSSSAAVKIGYAGREALLPAQNISGIYYVTLADVAQKVLNMKMSLAGDLAIVYPDAKNYDSTKERELLDRTDALFKGGVDLNITIDPRIELLNILKLLSSYNDGRVTQYDSAYKREVLSYFAKYADHPAITDFKNTNRMLVRDYSILLHYSVPPALKLQVPFEAQNDTFTPTELERYAQTLRTFAHDTDFMGFYRSSSKYYNAILKNTKSVVQGGQYPLKLTDYYGKAQQSFNMILAPLMVMVSYGPGIEWEKGKLDVYNITSTLSPVNDVPYFGSRERMREIIWHEFGHSYVNSLTATKRDEFAGYSSLIDNVKYKTAIYGNDWQICVNEHIVRAVTARLIYLNEGQQAGDAQVKADEELGFIYMKDICERLREYEKNRSIYKDFNSFLPRLIDVFKELYIKSQH